MINPYYLYMAEKEGYLNTREGKINKLITLLCECDDPNYYFDKYCNKVGLNQWDLTDKEANRIKREVEKYYNKKAR